MSAKAQVSTSSPYSRYGVGDIQFGGFAKNLGMGGIGYAISNPYNVNYANPASYANLSLTTFEAAGTGSMYELYTSTSEHGYQYNMDYGYLAMGFPIKSKKWGLSFGLLPFSNVGYSVTDSKVNAEGLVENHIYEGSGGLNQFYVGTGFLLGKNFYAGLNASFIFGTINKTGKIELPSNSVTNAKITDETIVNDFLFSAGIIKVFDSLKIAKSDSLLLFDKRIQSYEDSIAELRGLIISLNAFATETGSLASLRERYEAAITSLKSQMQYPDSTMSRRARKKQEKKNEALEDSIAAVEKQMAPLVQAGDVSGLTVKETQESFDKIIPGLNRQILEADAARELVKKRKQKSGWSLSVGLTGSPSLSLKAKHTNLTQGYYYVNGIEVITDTVTNVEDEKGKLVLPFCLGVGFAFKETNHWTIGADFSLQNWQEYSLFGVKDSLANSWRASGGFQWTPNDRSIKSYFSLIQYRLGGHFEQTYLQLRNTQLTDYGLSLGFGFPMKRVATTIQVAIEAGKRGTISNNLVQLNYVKCTLGFTLNDRWFVKEKFD